MWLFNCSKEAIAIYIVKKLKLPVKSKMTWLLLPQKVVSLEVLLLQLEEIQKTFEFAIILKTLQCCIFPMHVKAVDISTVYLATLSKLLWTLLLPNLSKNLPDRFTLLYLTMLNFCRRKCFHTLKPPLALSEHLEPSLLT